MSTKSNIKKTIDTLPTSDNAEKIKHVIYELKELTETKSEIPQKIQEIKFWAHLGQESSMSTKLMKSKQIGFSFNPSEREEKEMD